MNEYYSDCCGASPWLGDIDSERCGDCKEWCEFTHEDDLE